MVLEDVQTIEQSIAEGKRVLLDFWAPWCGPCRIMNPAIETLASEGLDLLICKIDIDENPAMAEKYQIRSVPTLVLFEGGEPTKAEAGAKNLDALKQFVGVV